jgi:hypothetical protein
MPVRAVVFDSTSGRYLERFLGDAKQMVAAGGRYSIITTDLVDRVGNPNLGYRDLAGQYSIASYDRASSGDRQESNSN